MVVVNNDGKWLANGQLMVVNGWLIMVDYSSK